MSLLSRLTGSRLKERAALRPLWHRIAQIAREKPWYADAGIADSMAGRFDAITLVLCAVLLRMERDADMAVTSVLLTELFVDDMDAQLRESGVGDLVVGKHIGKLMSVLGGRLGAYRAALANSDPSVLHEAISRNVSLTETGDAQAVAHMLRALARQLEDLPAQTLLAGEIAR